MSSRSLPLPSQAYLHQRFDYDPEGWLLWRHVENDTRCGRTWNSRFVGTRAGKLLANGYIHVQVDGQRYLAERLIWVWHHGQDPGILVVDHRDKVRSHNWIDNLRLGTSSQNARNKAGYSKLGLPKGVKLISGRYRPQIMVGQFPTPERAGDAVEAAAMRLTLASAEMAALMMARETEKRGLTSRNKYPRGVEFLRERNLYRGYLNLGGFDDPEEAGRAYADAAVVLFGEFARH